MAERDEQSKLIENGYEDVSETEGTHPHHKTKVNGAVLTRLLKTIRGFYPVLMPVVIICIIVNAAVSSLPAVFMQNILAVVQDSWEGGDWASASGPITRLVLGLIAVYALALGMSFVWTRAMATITQGSLMKLRQQMFDKMEDLPIRFFDTNFHGDIMSYYTNDVDALRQMISQSLPNLLLTFVTMVSVFCVMLWYSFWMSLVIICGIAFMMFLTGRLGGKSARYFLAQQETIAETEGYVEEAMNGERVIKVFCHEGETEAQFDEVNERLFEAADNANRYANTLGPVLMNLGNLIYVIVALAGGAMLVAGTPNVSISGLALSIAVVVPFLNMTKQFAGQIGQISHQINAIVMGLAGAKRIFALIDEEPERDEGYVRLVNVTRDENGKLTETTERTDEWAWKHPHSATGEVEYVPLEGDIMLYGVDFGYTPDHIVLHDISLMAQSGQKVAFVGPTGAGKTTITNLLNRFYYIADGKVRYDGINVNKIKKDDLRRSLGMVLQDTNLFTGSVMDNIRYGRLDATDQECIEAAKLAGADSFIERLPEGFQTHLSDNGSNLSQGQRQLLSIARAAVADPPVMILDEATSSIDTRTEQIVQRGMDALMKGRTTFVIAHRLSTVRDADAIIVLDHGRIIEKGSHEELLAKKGTYYQLYTGAFEME